MIDLSIIIVTYNGKEVLQKTLDSIHESDLNNIDHEIIVVDNGSDNETLQYLRDHVKSTSEHKFKLIENRMNLGFGAANNIAIRQSKAEYILLLNSDVILEKGTIKDQLQFMKDHPEYAGSTCRLVLANGNIDPACHRGFPTPWASFCYFLKLEELFPKSTLFGRYHEGWQDMDSIHDISAVSGALFMIKREVFEKIGLFDEGFFMYGEDLDLCLRLKKSGKRIGYNPHTYATHLKGQSGRSKNGMSKVINFHFWNAMRIFYRKHYEKVYPKVITYLVNYAINRRIKQYEQK